MEKDKTVEKGRSKEGKFLLGHHLQKRKKPISKEELEEALHNEAQIRGITLVRHAIQQAYTDNTVLRVILDKFVPNISVATSDIKPIQIIIEKYYQAEKGKTDKIIDIKAE